MRLTTDSNDTMHTILSDISEAIALLDSLSNEKAFTKGEWPRILEQDSSPSSAAAWKNGVCILQSSRMEDNREEEALKNVSMVELRQSNTGELEIRFTVDFPEPIEIYRSNGDALQIK